tara:strand:- start:162 stop:626 length:465 start_codon:yes stop_codon:yes gene_type:complete
MQVEVVVRACSGVSVLIVRDLKDHTNGIGILYREMVGCSSIRDPNLISVMFRVLIVHANVIVRVFMQRHLVVVLVETKRNQLHLGKETRLTLFVGVEIILVRVHINKMVELLCVPERHVIALLSAINPIRIDLHHVLADFVVRVQQVVTAIRDV